LINNLLVKNQGKASQIQSRNSNSSTEYISLFSLKENMPKGEEKTTTTTSGKESLGENITHNFKTPSSHTV